MFIDEQVVITLRIGAVLEVSGSVSAVGTIEVRYNGQLMRMFASDLLESGKLDSTTER